MTEASLRESGDNPELAVNLPRPKKGGRDELLWRLDVLNKFLLSAAPVARVTAGLGREVCAVLGFSRMVFLRMDFSSRRVKGAASYGLGSIRISRIEEPFEAGPWIEECVRAGWPAFTPDASNGPAIPAGYVRRFGIGPMLCVPVTDSQGPMGVMLLDRHGFPFNMSDELMEVARAVGASIGLALEAAATSRSHPNDETAQTVEPTPRELQMLRLLNRGFSNKEIATATGLSVFTVRDYVSSLLRCLGVTSRSAAVARAWEIGLLGDASEPEIEGSGEEPISISDFSRV